MVIFYVNFTTVDVDKEDEKRRETAKKKIM